MNHEQATKQQTTERYLLGELSEAERDAFEEHYFECAVCADDVRSASALVDAMRLSARQANPFLERQRAKQRRKFTVPLAAAASLIVGVMAMYLGFVTPLETQMAAERAPRVIEEYTLDSVRGPENQNIDHQKPFVLKVDLQTADQSPRYDFVVLNAAKQIQFTVPVDDGARARESTIRIRVAGGTLQPGNYILQVHGSEAVVASYPFVVR